MVSESEFKSEDPGFGPLVGQGEKGVFFNYSESTLVHLFVPDHPTCVRHAPKFVRTLKIPNPSDRRKRAGPTTLSRWYGNTKTMHTGKKRKSWVAPYYGCSLSPGKAARITRAIALGQEGYLI